MNAHIQNAQAQAVSTTRSRAMPLIACVFIGMFTIFAVGHAQSAALHDAAHDVRHAAGFPCH